MILTKMDVQSMPCRTCAYSVSKYVCTLSIKCCNTVGNQITQKSMCLMLDCLVLHHMLVTKCHVSSESQTSWQAVT